MRRTQRRRLFRQRILALQRRGKVQTAQAMDFFAFLHAPENQARHQARHRRTTWVRRRLRNYWDEVYNGDLWDDVDWRENMRMSRDTFDVICEHLRPAIERQDTRLRRPVPHHERVAITIWKLATVIEYRTLGQKFGLGRSTVCTIIHDTCEAICNILTPKYIKFPTGARVNDIVQNYNDRWGYPQCVGAIDGMHVPIKAPSQNPADYYNRKHFHSIVLQGVCDWNYRFIDVFFGFAGRAHDARVFSNSSIYHHSSL